MPNGVTVRLRSHWALSDSDAQKMCRVYPFLTIPLNGNFIARSSVSTEPYRKKSVFWLVLRNSGSLKATSTSTKARLINCQNIRPTTITTRQQSCGKVMFSVMSKILFGGRTVTLSPSLHIGQTLAPFSGLSVQGPLPDMFKLVQIESCCTWPPTDSYKIVH